MWPTRSDTNCSKPLSSSKKDSHSAAEEERTSAQMARFASSFTAYRIPRLSVELFLVVRIQELDGLSVSHAGFIFLVYSLANILTGVIAVWFPTIGFGSLWRSATFFSVSAVTMCGGFVAMFQVSSFGWMATFALITGFGTATWSIFTQTISNTGFPRAEQLGAVARMRQLFETVGFLLPSICLAIVVSLGMMGNDDDSSSSSSNGSSSFARQCAFILGTVAFGFSILSADQVTCLAANTVPNSTPEADKEIALKEGSNEGDVQCQTEANSSDVEKNSGKGQKLQGIIRDQEPHELEEELGHTPASQGSTGSSGLLGALKTFFQTSILLYFLLNALMLSLCNILMGTMSLITELYFGLDPEWLWLAAIAFPIGSIFAVGSQMVLSGRDDTNSKVITVTGLRQLILILVVCIVMGLFAWPRDAKPAVQKAMLFLFGFVPGMIYSVTYTASTELWLHRLKDFGTSFVSRAVTFRDLGVQVVMAALFQLQTVLVDAVITSSSPDTTSESSAGAAAETAVFFVPLIGLCLISYLIAQRLPYPKDAIFGWPLACSCPVALRSVVFFLQAIGHPMAAYELFFLWFYDFRTGSFSSHLDNSKVQDGPPVAETATLSHDALREHLQRFDELDTREEWWECEGQLRDVLLNNEEALARRLELIKHATSTIWMVTWLIEDSPSGEKLAEALIGRAKEGIEVRVMVDAVTLYYLHKKYKMRGMNDMGVLCKLANTDGVTVKMLDTVYEEAQPAYVIGNHRKILIVDDSWVITGGRNNNDRYFTTEGYHYRDVDVLLSGTFTSSTSELFGKLWNEARDVKPLIEYLGFKNASTVCDNGELLDKTEEYTSSDLSTREFDLEGAAESQTSPLATVLPASDVKVMQLDHKAGDPNGYDIIYASFLFLIETAQERIDLIMGLFQLFPELVQAIERAAARGVRIRLVTNSAATNGMPPAHIILRQSLERLLELDNVDIYVAADLDQYKEDGDFCLHYKAVIVDRKAAMVGSWNCNSVSVFYDSDFSIVMFGTDGACAFQPFEDLIDSSIERGMVVPITKTALDDFKIPLHFWLLGSKNAKKQMTRGF